MSFFLSTLQTLALELKKLYLAMSDKKNDLSKAMTQPGKNASQFLDCFDNLQVYLEHTQARAASRSKALKAGLDYTRSYQVRVWALGCFGIVLGDRTDLRSSFVPLPRGIHKWELLKKAVRLFL